MMKFCLNHPNQFSTPRTAFMMGMFAFYVGSATLLFNIFYLSTVNNTINVIIQQVALVSISKIPAMYSATIVKKNSPIKNMADGEGAKKFLAVENYRRARHLVQLGEHCTKCWYFTMKVIYGICRSMFCYFIYYLSPYIVYIGIFYSQTVLCAPESFSNVLSTFEDA